MLEVRRSIYKGHAVFEIWNGKYKVISFGKRKGEVVLECLEALKVFCETDSQVKTYEGADALDHIYG